MRGDEAACSVASHTICSDPRVLVHKGLSISLVIPAYNEEGGIGHVIENTPDYVDEIIVVDNNSTDRTGEIARSQGATAVFEQRRGYGSALRRGFQAATKDVIVTIDADGTYPTKQIAGAIDVLEDQNLDFISCSRFPLSDKEAMSARNVFGNRVLTMIFGLIYGRWLQDSQSGDVGVPAPHSCPCCTFREPRGNSAARSRSKPARTHTSSSGKSTSTTIRASGCRISTRGRPPSRSAFATSTFS